MSEPQINDYVRFTSRYDHSGRHYKNYGQIEAIDEIDPNFKTLNLYQITELKTGQPWSLTRKEFIIITKEEAIAAQIMEDI